MTDQSIVKATTKMCIEFQEAAASAYAQASMWIDGKDRYAPRVKHNQECAAMYAREAQIRLSKLIGA